MTEDDSDSPPPPANLVERVVSQQEKKAVDQLKKHRENIIKHLGGRNQKLKQAHKEIENFRNSLDNLASHMNSSIDATNDVESITYYKELWLRQEYDYVSWVDKQESLVEIAEEEIRKTSPQVQAKDDQIKHITTAILNKIKKYQD